MKISKKRGVLGVGRKFVLTLALFVLVFTAASIVKIQAAGNVTGWFWGGGNEKIPDADSSNWGSDTYTNVGWISLSRTNCDSNGDGSTDTGNYNCPVGTNNITTSDDYNVNIQSDGKVVGYAWSGGDASGSGLGWIDFNPQDHCGSAYTALSCYIPNSSSDKGGVFRSGDKLTGWARIVGIAQESASNNSGGWSGWVHMDGNYGIDLAKMTGDQNARTQADADPMTGKMTFITLGADELDWVDVSRAKYEARCDSVSLNDPIRVNAGSSADMTVNRDPSGLNAATIVTLTNQAPTKINNPPASVTINSGEDYKTFSFTAKTFQGADDQCEDIVADAIKADANCGSDLGTVIVERTCSVTCSPAKTDVTAGGSQTLTAKSTDYSGTGSGNFTWEIVENPGCASLGSCSGGSCDVATKQQDGTTSCAFKKVKVKASNCCGSAICELNLGRAGWIETNP